MISSKSIGSLFGICGVFFTSIMFYGCKEREIYPPVPEIAFKSHYLQKDPDGFGFGTDTLLGIIFTYRDGDGDIGLNAADTFPPFDRQTDSLLQVTNPYYYNIHIDYLEVKGGVKQPFIIPNTTDTFKIRARIASLTPDGKFKAIRGEIDHQFLPPLFPERSDSIVLRIRIYDRALNESNTVETPLIILP